MSASYKIRAKVKENEEALLQVTIRIEKNVFVDASRLHNLKSSAEGLDALGGLIDGAAGVDQLLKLAGPEKISTALLGMETEWQEIGQASAETFLEKWFRSEATFSAGFTGDLRDPQVLVCAGPYSMSLHVTEEEAKASKPILEDVADYCERNPPQTQTDVERIWDAVKGNVKVTSGIIAFGKLCLDASPRAPGAAKFFLALAGALGAFLGLMTSSRDQQQRDNEARERERMCEQVADENSTRSLGDKFSGFAEPF